MSLYTRNTLLVLFFTIFLIGCEDGATITNIKKDKKGGQSESDYMPKELLEKANAKEARDKTHEVIVNEVLPASKYVYLNVSEGNEEFWLATRKKDVTVGHSYTFKNALLKTNYESKEYNRMFEKIYLVNNLIPVNSAEASSHEDHKSPPASTIANTELIEHEGSMKIAELISDPKKYEGKTIQLSGKCVKINPSIMKRNWIHIQDGTQNDYDLLITSDVFVPEGEIFTMKGVVALNKDYGAGYKYEIIIENGELVK